MEAKVVQCDVKRFQLLPLKFMVQYLCSLIVLLTGAQERTDTDSRSLHLVPCLGHEAGLAQEEVERYVAGVLKCPITLAVWR